MRFAVVQCRGLMARTIARMGLFVRRVVGRWIN